MSHSPILIEIWSDFVCPFCYIGKRRLEEAIEQLNTIQQPEIRFRSFQLNPSQVTQPEISIHRYLADRKGISEAEARRMNDHVTRMAGESGLIYQMDHVVPANSLRAHRLFHFANTLNMGPAISELLFDAYFCQGRNIDDIPTLMEIAERIGIPPDEVMLSLTDDEVLSQVNQDILLASQFQIQGVPFFVFNRKLAVSGAQPVSVFIDVLNQLNANS